MFDVCAWGLTIVKGDFGLSQVYLCGANELVFFEPFFFFQATA